MRHACLANEEKTTGKVVKADPAKGEALYTMAMRRATSLLACLATVPQEIPPLRKTLISRSIRIVFSEAVD